MQLQNPCVSTSSNKLRGQMDSSMNYSRGQYFTKSTSACVSGAVGVARLDSQSALVAYGDGCLSVVKAVDADERIAGVFEFPPPNGIIETTSLAAAQSIGDGTEYLFSTALERAAGGPAARVSILDAERGSLRDALVPLQYSATALAVDTRQMRVACGAANGHVSVWDLNAGSGSTPSLRDTRVLAQGVGPSCTSVAFWPYSEENLVAAGYVSVLAGGVAPCAAQIFTSSTRPPPPSQAAVR